MLLPDARIAPLRGGTVLRWGVLAPGRIAHDWVRTVHANTDQRVVAVASRTLERAEAFAAEHGIPRSYGGYDELLAHPDVDIVYIAAPHSEHRALALKAIAAGKHVLVEKPIALNAAEAREIAQAARAAGVFAMEAMKARFMPQTDVIARLLDDGALGEVLSVSADFGARFDYDPASRAFDPALGGGALLDLGVYPLWFSHFVLGAPERVTARGSLAPTGVEDQAALLLDFAGGAQSVVTTSMRAETPQVAAINGTAGRIEVAGPFHSPGSLRVVVGADVSEWHDSTGLTHREVLCFQAAAVAQSVGDGLTESPLHTLDDAVAVLAVIDAARAQLGAR